MIIEMPAVSCIASFQGLIKIETYLLPAIPSFSHSTSCRNCVPTPTRPGAAETVSHIFGEEEEQIIAVRLFAKVFAAKEKIEKLMDV